MGIKKPGGVGVAAADRAEHATAAQRIAQDEPQPELKAGALNPALRIKHPGSPRLRQQLDRLLNEPARRGTDPRERGEELVIAAGRAAKLHGVEDLVHRRA